MTTIRCDGRYHKHRTASDWGTLEVFCTMGSVCCFAFKTTAATLDDRWEPFVGWVIDMFSIIFSILNNFNLQKYHLILIHLSNNQIKEKLIRK